MQKKLDKKIHIQCFLRYTYNNSVNLRKEELFLCNI